MRTNTVFRWQSHVRSGMTAGIAAFLGAGVLVGMAGPGGGGGGGGGGGNKRFVVHNLVSDGTVPADHTDANLVNAWGIVPNPTGFWWVSDNGTGLSTLYDGSGVPNSLVVTIPKPAGDPDPAKVTGIVFSGSSDFSVTDGVTSGPARFIFATEDGIIAGWAPAVPLPAPSTQAHIAVNNNPAEAIYKGLAIAQVAGHGRLYATDFHNGHVDIFNSSFGPVHISGAFEDHRIPAGFAPFGIQNIGGKIFVTFAKQDEDAEDDVAGKGLGYVDVFDTDGTLLKRFASRGKLNAPWGMVLAPDGFGKFAGDVLIGNFGDGRISVFDLNTGNQRGQLRGPKGRPIQIEGLWGLGFGNGAQAGPVGTLFFSAGPSDEEHGVFGRLDPAPKGHGDDDGDDDDDGD